MNVPGSGRPTLHLEDRAALNKEAFSVPLRNFFFFFLVCFALVFQAAKSVLDSRLVADPRTHEVETASMFPPREII